MSPTLNFLALVRAFDLQTPPAESKEEMRLQSQAVLDDAAPLIKAVSSLFPKNTKNSVVQQSRFDALLSVAFDVGLDAFFCSPLPDTVRLRLSRNAVREAFLSLPEFDGTLRSELRDQLELYRMPLLSRRAYESELFLSRPCFTFGRTRFKGSDEIVYASSVIHPIVRFMMG